MSRLISVIHWLACFVILIILQHKVGHSSPQSNSTSSSAHGRCSPEESFALLHFKTTYFNTSCFNTTSLLPPRVIKRPCTYKNLCRRPRNRGFCDVYKPFPNWKEGSDCCSWDGVTCDGVSGHVIKLDLSCSEFGGAIGSNSSLFDQLPHLQSLNLSSSEFSGAIPLEISNLSKLEFLDLSFNHFEGEIPNCFSNLKKIKVLRLDFNRFTGGFPSSFSNLSQLNYLSISCNELTGNLPVKTSGFQLISVMDLSFNCFNGTLPTWPFNRPSLVILDFSGNQLTGEIPSHLGNLPSLVALDLSDNQLTGDIPSHIRNLFSLSDMDLSSNSFNGTLPAWLFDQPSLVTLDLSDNQLTGEIPPYIGNLCNLSRVDLSFNSLNGTLPARLFNLPSLVTLNLSHNQLTGEIPFHIDNLLVNLIDLDLSYNNLTGFLQLDVFSRLQVLEYVVLSYNIGLSANSSNKAHSPLHQLYTFEMSSCNVSSFPYFLKNFIKLQRLDLSNNKIRGSLPEWLSTIGKSSLEFLNLSHNSLTSTAKILPWSNLGTLDLSFNLLQGALPIPLTVEEYLISNNKLSGEIQPRICELRMLELVDFSNNGLSGNIPNCLFNLSKMNVLKLRRNIFSGTIPEVVGGVLLGTIDLSENQLRGQIPRSLTNCTYLEILNLGNNFISDTFPMWLEVMPELAILMLGTNKFYGSIAKPRNVSAFAKLSVIDLSHNNFFGELPSAYFHTWKSMMIGNERKFWYRANKSGDYYINSVSLTYKDQKMELVRTLTIFKAVDFSNNKFEGKIPESIGKLKSLIVLNLSSNDLTGKIPTSLGDLRQLESLDFSNNKLSGRIPPQLSSLTFLGAFNVSQNNLEGPIPQTGQLAVFSNDSYKGNPGLCGIPLTKKCEDVASPHPPILSSEEDQNSDDILDGFNWKSVTIGYGCGIVIGVVIGHIIIKRNEEWFLSLFNIRLLWRFKKPAQAARE